MVLGQPAWTTQNSSDDSLPSAHLLFYLGPLPASLHQFLYLTAVYIRQPGWSWCLPLRCHRHWHLDPWLHRLGTQNCSAFPTLNPQLRTPPAQRQGSVKLAHGRIFSGVSPSTEGLFKTLSIWGYFKKWEWQFLLMQVRLKFLQTSRWWVLPHCGTEIQVLEFITLTLQYQCLLNCTLCSLVVYKWCIMS